MRRHVAAHLASFKVPEIVEFTDEPLPRNPAGKLLKNVLRGTAARCPFDAVAACAERCVDVRDLAGRTVLVTGAGSGIGRESALAFARRGADLVLCDLNAEGLERDRRGDPQRSAAAACPTHVVDVADAEQMARLRRRPSTRACPPSTC